jgi:hypothetical protein
MFNLLEIFLFIYSIKTMGGGLMQLVAYGAQDIYLTGNPQITFFKVVYRRHTNFAMEAVEQTMNGSAAYGGKAVATVSRNGDLVGRMYVEHTVEIDDSAGSSSEQANNYGHALLRTVTCEIGGQEIDKQTGRWMQIWADLTEFNPTGSVPTAATTALLGEGTDATLFQKMSGTGKGSAATDTQAKKTYKIFVPLQFWFNRNPGLALPLIALQYHEVKVTIQFENENLLVQDTGGNCTDKVELKLYADYIYLDTDERRRFAQVSHEYLIEQVQTQDFSMTSGTKASHNLTFNHPVKELVWQCSKANQNSSPLTSAMAGNESTLACGMTMDSGTVGLKLNGHERFAERDVKYFTRTQVWQHHTGNSGTVAADSVGVYSFALKPEEHQPSGTCNFSRIDNAELVATITGAAGSGKPGHNDNNTPNPDTLHVYAVNYNVLRVMSGMGGLAYSN